MKKYSKAGELADLILYDIFKEKVPLGEKLKSKTFFVNKYLANPNLVDKAFEILLKLEVIEQRDGEFYVSLDTAREKSLKNQYANTFLNEYIEKCAKAGISPDDALKYASLRARANG